MSHAPSMTVATLVARFKLSLGKYYCSINPICYSAVALYLALKIYIVLHSNMYICIFVICMYVSFGSLDTFLRKAILNSISSHSFV